MIGLPSFVSSHPGSRTLQRFADGECAADGRDRVARHLASCHRCREAVRFARDVALSAREEAVPAPPVNGLAGVLAARARGDRVILPAAEDVPRAVRALGGRRARVAMASVAGLAALALGVALVPDREHEATVRVGAHTPTMFWLLPGTAYAQEPTGPDAAAAPAPIIDGTRARPGRWEYELTVTRGGRPVEPAERGVMQVDRVAVAGVGAWRARTEWLGHPHDMRDDIVLHGESLRLLTRSAWDVGFSRFTVHQRFVGDSLLGTMTSTTPVRPAQRLARELPRRDGPYGAGDVYATLLMQSVQLEMGWRARVALVGWGAVPSDLYYPVTMAVEGEERVRVPAGTFDCWRLSIRATGWTKSMWVRKADGVPVRTRGENLAGGAVVEVVLLTESSPPPDR